ncbi:MAG: efflux RND transporter periplasmic adaptor subunit [Steroidobacteraceae bacterium]|jgi:multidrug efflux system membrane fusion protein
MSINNMNEVPNEYPLSDPQPTWRDPRGFVRTRPVLSLILAAIFILLCVGIFMIIRHGKNIQVPGQRRPGQNGPMAVAVATATSGEIAVKLPALGTVTPLATVTVQSQISGQLQVIGFKEGQLVRAGDFLAQIDPRPYQAALDQAQGNLRRDQALLADANLDEKRYETLVAEDSIASQTLDTQKALVKQYEGTVASDEATVATARVNLAYCHIVSPVTGRVGLRQVDQGNYITPALANGIVVVTQLSPMSIIFPVPEDNLPQIQKRVASGATLTVEAWDRTNTVKLADGKLETLDNEIDPTTGTIKLRALFDNKDGGLFANQFVNIQLLVDTLQNQVIMPIAAVQHGAPNGVNSTFVYLVGADSTVSVHPVTLGTVDGERVAVASGLNPGDVVVTQGGDRLRDGATVQLPSNTPAPTATPGTSGAHKGNRSGRRNGQGSAPGGGPPGGGPPGGGPP